jgi:Uma2 family endonuclease
MTLNTYASTVSATQQQVDDLVLDILPAQGQWSEEAYLWLTDHTTRLIEFTDGYIEVLPMPTDAHQTLVLFLYELLVAFLRPRRGKVLVAPLRLKIRDRKYREPDILLVASARDPRRQNRFWLGADLVVEVVSPDKPERDLIDKRTDYAEARIPEYWIVNPQSETVTILRLEATAYVEHGVFGRGSEATSVVLDGFTVNTETLFDAE